MSQENNAQGAVDFSTWESESIGNYPYWAPELSCTECKRVMGDREFKCSQHPSAPLAGNEFHGTIVLYEPSITEAQEAAAKGDYSQEGSGTFGRYVVQAASDQEMKIGKKEDGEVTDVKKDDYFTCSVYAALPLSRYFGIEVRVLVKGKKMIVSQRQGGQKVPVWEFGLQVDPATKKMLNEARKALGLEAARKHREKILASAGMAPPKALSEKTSNSTPAETAV